MKNESLSAVFVLLAVIMMVLLGVCVYVNNELVGLSNREKAQLRAIDENYDLTITAMSRCSELEDRVDQLERERRRTDKLFTDVSTIVELKIQEALGTYIDPLTKRRMNDALENHPREIRSLIFTKVQAEVEKAKSE